MVSGSAPGTLERKIYFYRADIGADEGGQPLAFDPVPALDAIDSLPFTNDAHGRYEFDADGNALSVRRNHNVPNVTLQFGRVRRNGLPQLEQAGNISDLVLDADAGLLEAIHVVFFPNNIVGAEYNHFGPRVSRLGSFLHDKSGKAVPRATFSAILRGEAAKQLDRLSDLRVLELSVLPSYVDVVRQSHGSLADALAANGRVLENPKVLQVILKPQQDASTGFLAKMIGGLKELVSNGNVREGADRLQVHGKCEDTDRVETIDLLKDQLISTKAIVRMNPRSRALVPAAAFQAIQEAYRDLHDELTAAASVS